jgi:hypothetical protein
VTPLPDPINPSHFAEDEQELRYVISGPSVGSMVQVAFCHPAEVVGRR